MTDRPWWAFGLQMLLWGLVMTGVMGWLSRSRIETGDSTDALVPPKSILWLYGVCSAFFAALAVLSFVFPGSDPAPWATLVFIGFCAMGTMGVVDYFRGRHLMTEDGLRYGKLLGAGGLARWDEVRSVRYSESMRWFRVETGDGRVIRISGMLRGLPSFAEAALRRVSPEALDPETRGVLHATAAGELPSIWG